MPSYTYKCTTCGEICGTNFSFDQDVPEELDCCECDGKMKRVLDAPEVIYNGSGFYSTDERSDRDKRRKYHEHPGNN